MNLRNSKFGYLLAFAGGLMWASLGCAKQAEKAGSETQSEQQTQGDEHADHEHDGHDHEGHDHEGHDHDHDGHDHKDDHASASHKHDHSSWWCDEHGVPEEVCGQCNAKLAADFQKKGDWCDEHDRPESQCFICNPDLQAKFAAEYEAKYGKQPPQLEL